MTKSLPMLFVLLLALLAAPVALAAPQAGEQSAQAIVLGVPLPLSGRLADFGLMMQNSFELAKQTVNADGGVNGRLLELTYADDQGDPRRARKVIGQLIDDAGAVMLVGGYQSDVTYAMARIANNRDVPFLISTAATDRITQQGWRNIYRLNPPASEYALSLQDFLLKELHPKSMAIVYENSMFGTDGAVEMMGFSQANGIEVRDLIGYSRQRATPLYFRSLLAPLTREPPDVIHMISYLADGAALIKTIRELAIPSQLTGGAAGFTHPRLLDQAGEAAEGLLVATLWSSELPYPGAKEYAERYQRSYGSRPGYHGAEAYSALLVAADALRRAADLTPAAIRQALDQTFTMTPFGPVKFYSYDDFARQNSVRTQVLQIRQGRFEVVWPPELATAALAKP